MQQTPHLVLSPNPPPPHPMKEPNPQSRFSVRDKKKIGKPLHGIRPASLFHNPEKLFEPQKP